MQSYEQICSLAHLVFIKWSHAAKIRRIIDLTKEIPNFLSLMHKKCLSGRIGGEEAMRIIGVYR